jgi:RNA polymerase sigma factor (sigma-70 family)
MGRQTAAAVIHLVQSTANASAYGVSDRDLLRRFADADDQAAFAALVRRHTEMVLGVCRRALANQQDAEDACQATFLVLAQKAKSKRWQPSVANWLFTTARKVARNARVIAQRRARREARAAHPEVVQPVDQLTGRELLTVLDEELDRLPPRYRAPLVLCYLEGLTRDEAADRLSVPMATLKTQLERGRKRLGDALTRRGCALGAGLLALAATTAAEASSARLVASILATASGSAPATVAALVKGVAVNGLMNRFVLLMLAGTTALGIGLGTSALIGAGQPPNQGPSTGAASPPAFTADARPRPDVKARVADNKDAIAYSGRVVGPDGRPVAGAKLYLTLAYGYPHEPEPSPEYGTSGPDGRFAFTVSKKQFGKQSTVVAAAAANFGVGWADVPGEGKRDDLTLQLVRDDVPITGQIVDLEGKPVRGATLRLIQINAAEGENVSPFLEAARKKEPRFPLERKHLPRYTIAVPLQATTDDAGRFRLSGIGRNRLMTAQLDGPTIMSQHLHMLTRPGAAMEVPEADGRSDPGDRRKVVTYHPASFRHVAAPTKPIVGVVRDKDTKQALAGITVRSMSLTVKRGQMESFDLVRTTTDAEGRYRLTGMPKREGNLIVAVPSEDQPYVAINREVPNNPGLDPVTVDFEMKRGIWIEGRITDKATGKPVPAGVQYFSLSSNPHLEDYPGFDGTFSFPVVLLHGMKKDGSYRLVGLPGPGLIVVWRDFNYLLALDRDDEYGIDEKGLSTAPYALFPLQNYGAFARIDPAKGVEKAVRNVTLDPGWTFTGTVLGPDGKRLAGAWGYGVGEREAMKTAEFTVRAFNPRRPRDLLFRHLEKGLIGVAQPPKENGGAITARMEPGAAVSGRLVDTEGRPRPGVELKVRFRPKPSLDWDTFHRQPVQTDREGQFRIGALLPGYEYQLSDDKGDLHLGDGLHAGQTKDLGDVQIRRTEE